MAPFVIFSLPRSRSAWLSVLLSSPDRTVGHDIGIECASPADFVRQLIDRGGTCETGAAFAWRLIKEAIPGVKFAVVLRRPDQVTASLDRLGLTGQGEEMARRWRFLIEIADQPGTFVCAFDDLANEHICAGLYEHCTGETLDAQRWAQLDQMNIQVDMPRRIDRLRLNHDRIGALKAELMASA